MINSKILNLMKKDKMHSLHFCIKQGILQCINKIDLNKMKSKFQR